VKTARETLKPRVISTRVASGPHPNRILRGSTERGSFGNPYGGGVTKFQ